MKIEQKLERKINNIVQITRRMARRGRNNTRRIYSVIKRSATRSKGIYRGIRQKQTAI